MGGRQGVGTPRIRRRTRGVHGLKSERHLRRKASSSATGAGGGRSIDAVLDEARREIYGRDYVEGTSGPRMRDGGGYRPAGCTPDRRTYGRRGGRAR